MKSQKHRNLAELFILLFGGLMLSVNGVKHVISVISMTPGLPATAYGAGELAGELTSALCPLAIGLGLFVIARRHTRKANTQAR